MRKYGGSICVTETLYVINKNNNIHDTPEAIEFEIQILDSGRTREINF